MALTPSQRIALAHRIAKRSITDKTSIEFDGSFVKTSPIEAVQMEEAFEVETLEGTMQGKAGDWLAQGVEGERWPIDADIFDKTYKKTAAEVYTSSGVLYVLTPETLAQVSEQDQWVDTVSAGLLEDAHGLVEEYGGAVLREPSSGTYSVETVAKWASRVGAQVGTDTATIFAISPEGLKHVVDKAVLTRSWEEWVDHFGEIENLVRTHGGAVFHTGADGAYEVVVSGGPGDLDVEIGGEGFLPPYGTPDYGRVASAHWLATQHQARVVKAQMKEAGWWSLNGPPPVPKGGLQNAIPGVDPDQGEHYLGDGPLDARIDFIEKIDEMYRRTWNRSVTTTELQAIMEVPVWAEEDEALYGSWPMNQWVDVAAQYMDVPQSVVLSLPEDSLRDARRLWREHRNSGIQIGVPITRDTVPERTVESLQAFVDHIRASFYFAQRDAVEMVDAVDPDKIKLAKTAAGDAHARSIALMKFLSGVAKSLGSNVGRHVYVVGGAVRDFVLDRPIKDVDVVIDSVALGGRKDSEWFAKQVVRSIPARVSMTTNQYGVALLNIADSWILDGLEMQGEDIEIANARSESYGGAGGKGYKPSEVVPSTIEEDVVRRELTYNTLMIRLMDLASGPDKADIVDLTGCGLRDLEQGVMQCPADPNKVFSDDPSRMVRVIKFALRYGHKLTPDTLAAIRRNADKLKNVPSGHLSQMLASLVLKESTWKPALEMMADLGLLDPVREMLLEDKSFRAAVQNHVNNGRMDMMFGLMDVGLPLGTRVQFLSGPELTRLREITLGMDRDEAWEYLGSVKNPGNAYKDKRFIPGLAQQYGFQGKGMARFMPVVISVGRQLLLADPALAHDPNRLKRLVEQGVGDEMKRTKLAEATGKTTGYRESVGLFIPLPELLADQFPPPGGNDTSPSHVTLFYGGMVPEDREEEYLDVLRRTLAGVGPVKARIGDLDYFTHVEKNRRVAYVRVWFSKDMGSLRDRIRSAISDAGFEAKDSFPLAYNPHITLQYMDDLTEEYSGPVPEGTWQFDSIPVWGLPKEHSIPLRGGSAVRVACAHLGEPGLLPVMSPVFNLREIAKQLLLLEDHLFHPGKRCPDCVKKHTLMAEALAEEAVTLDPSGQLDLTGLADDVRAIGQSIASEPLEVAAQNIRQLRKALVAFIGAAALVGVDG